MQNRKQINMMKYMLWDYLLYLLVGV